MNKIKQDYCLVDHSIYPVILSEQLPKFFKMNINIRNSVIISVVLTIIVIFISLSVYGENTDSYIHTVPVEPSEIIDSKSVSRFYELYNELISIEKEDSIYPYIEEIMESECKSHDELKIKEEVYDRQFERFDSDPGLNFDIGYRSTIEVTDDDSHSIYAGLTWKMLDDGLFENKNRAETAKYNLALSRLRYKALQLNRMTGCRHDSVIYYFNNLKLNILNIKFQLLSAQYDLLKKLYFLGVIHLDETVRVEERLRSVENMIDNFRLYINAFDHKDTARGFIEPPFIDIHIEKLLQEIKEDDTYEKIADMEKKIIEGRNIEWDKRRFNIFVRQGLDIDENNRGTGNTTFGLNLSIPLFEDTKSLIDIEKREKDLIGKLGRLDIMEHTKRSYYEYRYKVGDAIKLHYKQLYVTEKLRREFIYNRINMGNLPIIINKINDLTDIDFEIIDLKEKLYIGALKILSDSGRGYNSDFIKSVDFVEDQRRLRVGERAIYIWSHSFNLYDNNFIFDLLTAKSIDRALLSASKKINSKKLLGFLDRAKELEISVELVGSSTEWIFPENFHKVKERVQRLYSINPVVHLDIEPQILSDYSEKRDIYIRYYLEMLHGISLLKEPDQTLSVSVPLHFRDYLNEICEFSDIVYVMAYGIRDWKKMKSKMAPFLESCRDQIVLSLRYTDFDRELDMETFIEKIKKETAINRFAFHDVKRLITMVERQP